MNKLSNTYLRLAIAFALVGVAIGYGMGASEDHTLAPAHAHINLLGWVSMFLYGLFYRAFPAAAVGLLPKAQLWCAVLGFLIMIPALTIKLLALTDLAAVSAIGLIVGSTLVVVGMILMAVIIFRATSEKAAA
jgi:hypothetical protein